MPHLVIRVLDGSMFLNKSLYSSTVRWCNDRHCFQQRNMQLKKDNVLTVCFYFSVFRDKFLNAVGTVADSVAVGAIRPKEYS